MPLLAPHRSRTLFCLQNTVPGIIHEKCGLVLYYCLEDPDTPQWACRIIKGALVYFVMPIDAIPDFIPFTGFADDLAVLVLAMALVVIHIKPEHRKMAEEKMGKPLVQG